jgi:acyl carrier protein
MTDGWRADELVRSVIAELWPERFDPHDLADEVPLGEQGLGLDSIEMAELVVACEDASGVLLDDEVFRQGPLTVRGVIDYFSRDASSARR